MTPDEGMDGVARVFILGFLDKPVRVDVLRESHGGGEKQREEF